MRFIIIRSFIRGEKAAVFYRVTANRGKWEEIISIPIWLNVIPQDETLALPAETVATLRFRRR